MILPILLLGLLLDLLAHAPAPACLADLAVVNESASLPRGVYLRAGGAVATGSIVTVRPPPAARTYLDGLGAPSDVRLLKRVAAVAGDGACRAPGAVLVAGRRLAVRERDRRGAALPAWRGCRTLGADEVFVAGDTSTSFDSRYFGPVRRTAVRGPYRPVLTW